MSRNRLTTEQFVERARAIHGDKYDYGDVEYVSMAKRIRIKCKKHGVFLQSASSHVNPLIKAGCPYCSRKALFRGENDLATVFPKIAQYYDAKKNGNTASDIAAKSNKCAWWTCDNGHSFSMKVLNRIRKEKSCPYCSGQKLLVGFNDLQTRYPTIADEWDFDKSEGGPSDYRYGSGYNAWWVCKTCGKSYQSPINVHTKGHKCPYCGGVKVAVGKTDLQTLFPDVAKEYASDNELPANQISSSTHKKVKWICPHCNGEYWASPHHRTSKNKTECPFCKKQSKGERQIKRILDEYGITYRQQERFSDLRGDGGKPLIFDFTLYRGETLIGVIEYNGQQHYKPVEMFGGEAAYKRQLKYDKKKEMYCSEQCIPMLQIAYCCPSIVGEIVAFLKNIIPEKIECL